MRPRKSDLLSEVIRQKAQADRPQVLLVGGEYVPPLCEQLRELNGHRKPGWKIQTIEGSLLFGLRIEVMPGQDIFEVR
jgi:hypothetical protein